MGAANPRCLARPGVIFLALAVASCSGDSAIDFGAALSPAEFTGGPGSAQARLVSDLDGTPILSWLEPEGDGHALKFARIAGGRLTEAEVVVRSERMFVNWADFPSVTPVSDDLWFAHWLQRQPDSYAYDIATLISVDGGASWTEAEQMNEDMTAAEHGFVSAFAWNGRLAAFWLDGRELADFSFDDPDALLGTSLRLAQYDSDGKVTSRRVVDELVCDCCQPDVAMTNTGPVVVYRNRTEDEIRDIVVSRYDGNDWSAPVTLGDDGWRIEACPVNGPVIAAQGSEVVAVWFTAPDYRGHVRMARSGDGAASFGPAVEVDGNGALGQPSVILDRQGQAIVSWWRRGSAGGIDLMLRVFGADGAPGAERVIAHETVGQPVDVPQMLRSPDGLVFAWTTFDGEGSVRITTLGF